MKTAIRYYTRSGNTKKLAEAVSGAVGVPALAVDQPLTERVDTLFLGCSYYAFDVDEAVKTFVAQNRANIGRIVLFGTSAMMKSVYKPMKKVAEANGVALEREDFHCRGSFGPAHKGRPDKADCERCAAFALKALSEQSGPTTA